MAILGLLFVLGLLYVANHHVAAEFAAALERAKQESLALVKDKKYGAASASASQFRTNWSRVAAAVGRQDEVERFAEGYAFLADLARLANRPDPK